MEGRLPHDSTTDPHLGPLRPTYEDVEHYDQPLSQSSYRDRDQCQQESTSKQPPQANSGRKSERAMEAGQFSIKRKPCPSSQPSAQYSESDSHDSNSPSEKINEKAVSQNVYMVSPGQPGRVQRSSRPVRESKLCGLPKKRFLLLSALLLCTLFVIAVVLGIVFGLQLSRSHNASSPASPTPTQSSAPTPSPTVIANPNFEIGGVLNPKYYSTTGAFNGTGLALASVNFGVDSSLYVYYQHHTGEIRSMILEANGDWTDSNIVATDAKNATPLSVVAFLTNDVAQWHLFYINQNGYISQRTSSNSSTFQTNIWQDGPLNELNLKANDAELVGLQCCFWGAFYGDSDYTFGDGPNPVNSTAVRTGMDLWYADSDTSFQQYSWLEGDAQWSATSFSWNDQNGHAGVGCYSWATGSTQYVFMVDSTNALQVYWKDSNSSNETPTHPVNTWNVIDAVTIPNVHPSTSMGYTNYLVCQLEDYTIHGYNLTWQAENTTFAPALKGESEQYDEFIVAEGGQNVLAVPGTHLTNTAVSDLRGGANLDIFLQTKGNDVTIFSRADALAGGAWTSTTAPVNQ